MTRDEIARLPANRETDALIAERVMGWEKSPARVSFRLGGYLVDPGENVYTDKSGNTYATFEVPEFTKDIAAAWQVMDWMRENTVEKYTAPSLFSVPHGWSMVLYEKNDNHAPAWLDAFAPTAPLAICRAALLAVMETE